MPPGSVAQRISSEGAVVAEAVPSHTLAAPPGGRGPPHSSSLLLSSPLLESFFTTSGQFLSSYSTPHLTSPHLVSYPQPQSVNSLSLSADVVNKGPLFVGCLICDCLHTQIGRDGRKGVLRLLPLFLFDHLEQMRLDMGLIL